MEKNEFLELELEEQIAYLNGLCDEGKEMADIEAALGLTQRELGANGLYMVRGKFMGKPMRGYQTAKRSGNEYQKTDGGGWREEDSAAKVTLT